jgi:hypothetical protein
LALLGAVVGLAPCSTPTEDLPSLTDPNSGSANPLIAPAQEFYDCMIDAGVPVEQRANTRGELTLVDLGGPSTRWLAVRYGDDGQTKGSNYSGATDSERLTGEAFLSASNEPGLLIDGGDYSSVYATCLDSSRYSANVAMSDDPIPPMDPADLRAQVEANNRWASCARDHGWPSVKDSVMPTNLTNWEDYPKVSLSQDISDAQLRQLLADCPNFDVERAQANADWMKENAVNPDATMPAELTGPDPMIEVVYTGPIIGDDSSDDDKARLEANHRLNNIIQESVSTFICEAHDAPDC